MRFLIKDISQSTLVKKTINNNNYELKVKTKNGM